MFDKNNKKIYITENNSTKKVHIVKLENNRYAALKPLKTKFIKLDKMLKSFLHKDIREHILQYILKNKISDTNIINEIDN